MCEREGEMEGYGYCFIVFIVFLYISLWCLKKDCIVLRLNAKGEVLVIK